jgi:molybdopterin converting factor small subunit
MSTSATYHIHYIGLLEDRRGLREESVQSTATTPLALFTEINACHPLGMQTSDCRAVVNDAFVAWDHPLAHGDHVAFLPPMSGG